MDTHTDAFPNAVFAMAVFRTQHHPHWLLSAPIAKNRMGNASVCPKRRRVVEVNVLSGMTLLGGEVVMRTLSVSGMWNWCERGGGRRLALGYCTQHPPTRSSRVFVLAIGVSRKPQVATIDSRVI